MAATAGCLGSPLSPTFLTSLALLSLSQLSHFALNHMPLFIGIHGVAPLVLLSTMVATVSSSFNNGGCQPLTFQKGCCICQWTVPSINGCCTLMATNPTITPFAIYVGNCPLASSAHACILQLFQAYHSESVFGQVSRYLPNLSITRVIQAPLCLLQRITSTRWFVISHLKSV